MLCTSSEFNDWNGTAIAQARKEYLSVRVREPRANRSSALCQNRMCQTPNPRDQTAQGN